MRLARPRAAAATFVVGCLLVLLVDASLARIAGVPLIFAGLILGVAAIATPDFLAADRDERGQPQRQPVTDADEARTRSARSHDRR